MLDSRDLPRNPKCGSYARAVLSDRAPGPPVELHPAVVGPILSTMKELAYSV